MLKENSEKEDRKEDKKELTRPKPDNK